MIVFLICVYTVVFELVTNDRYILLCVFFAKTDIDGFSAQRIDFESIVGERHVFVITTHSLHMVVINREE